MALASPPTACSDSSTLAPVGQCSAPPLCLKKLEGHRRAGWRGELRHRVLHFTPSWFSVNMGTGITSIILFNLPYGQSDALHIVATIVFVLNIVLFLTFLVATVTRYAVWPRVWGLMINHPVQSLFWGTFAMGFATIVDGVALIAVPAFGKRFVSLAWALWWIDSAISMVVAFGIPYVMFTRHVQETALVTGVWLLPVVAPIVAAAAGGIVADVLLPDQARLTIIISYIMLGSGLLPAILIMALYFQRLAIHKVPPSAVIVSVFLPIGPCGQSAFALLQLAGALRKLQDETGSGIGGNFTLLQNEIITSGITGVSVVAALGLWGFGMFWLVTAVLTVGGLGFSSKKGGLPFNMGWWGFTFPIGTMATAAIQFSSTLDSIAFKVVAMILCCAVIALWLYIAARTVVEGYRGTVFVSPCLGQSGDAHLSEKEKLARAMDDVVADSSMSPV